MRSLVRLPNRLLVLSQTRSRLRLRYRLKSWIKVRKLSPLLLLFALSLFTSLAVLPPHPIQSAAKKGLTYFLEYRKLLGDRRNMDSFIG